MLRIEPPRPLSISGMCRPSRNEELPLFYYSKTIYDNSFNLSVPPNRFYGPATDDYIHPYGHMTTGARRATALFSKGWVGIKGLLPAVHVGGNMACGEGPLL